MEVKKKNKKVVMSEQRLEKTQDPLQEEKNKLKKQIEKLQSIILQLECELDLYAFKNIKIDTKSNALNTFIDLDVSQIPDVNVELESQLFRFAGFRCLQFNKQEFVFNLSPSNKYDKENIFAIQVLCKNTKWTLGKWTMPMSIDLEDLVDQFSNNIKDVPNFIRTCKHYLDCYLIRHEQFNALKGNVSSVKNCTLQVSDGYTHMMITLMGVHSTKYDEYINVDIYIDYKIDEVRPNKVDIGSQDKQELNTETMKQLKNSVQCFKSFDLSIAFEKMWNDSPFTWSKKTDDDSPLGINISDSSDDGGVLNIDSLPNKKSARLKKRQKKGDLYISRNVRRYKESGALQNEKSNAQNSSQHSINENTNNETLASTSRVNKNNETTTSPNFVHKLYQKKLKQLKLNFQSAKHSHVNPGTSRALVTPEKYILHQDADKVITSTPMHQKDSIVMETDDLDNISAISNAEQSSKTNSIRKRKRDKRNNE